MRFNVSMSIAHALTEFVPSMLLGVPQEGTATSILPGHRMVLQGRSKEVIRIVAVGGFGAIVITILMMPVFAVTLPFFVFQYQPMSGLQWLFLICTGISAAGGQIFITKAYSYAPAREISVYDFSIVLFTALWGFLFLDQIPDYLSVIGYVVIIGTSVVKWYITIERPHRQEIHREHELNDR